MNKVDLIGELSAGVSLAGEISVAPGHGPAIRIRAALPAKWPAEYPDGGRVAYFAHAEGEREPVEFHSIAGILPLIEGKEFDALVADINAHGLREPIILFNGQILDGRNRYRACMAAGVEPRFRDFDGDDPLAFVVSMNLQRRHLNESQRAMVAARLANMRQGARTDLGLPANLPEVSQRQAGSMLNVSERTVRSAVKVRDSATPELVQAVDRGDVPVSVAAQLAEMPPEIQRRAAAEPTRATTLVKQAVRAEREAELAARQTAVPNKRYGVIYADPPWRFEAYSEDTGQGRAAEAHYPTMSPEAIAGLPIGSIAADDCVLFMWTTGPTMPEAFDLLKAWGFDYRAQCIWAKDKFGLGFWFRNQHEILIVAIKGKVPAPAHGTQWPSLIQAARGKHSEKPAVFYELIEAYFPTLPKIELFARGKARPGWDAWGNEVEPAMTFRIVDGWIGRGSGSARAYEELPAHNPERMKGQSKPCWTPFPISTIIHFEDGCRTMDVGSWLRSLGLEQYDALFRESEIDAEVLPDLTEGDLNQLGVPLGHRKRLLKAIAGLGTAETVARPSSTAPSSPTDAAERRPITVMFCDLVGSTSLAATLDAEDWRNLVNAYLDQASAAVTDFGGYILKKLGDGLMALFGYPQAQENDAERAVRAALAIQRALFDLNARNAAAGVPELSARVGLESGPVVVDATGEVFGEAPNVAARVQAAAEPGSVLITGSVQRQVAGLFVVEEKGAHELKGLAQPLTLYRVVRASGGGRRGGMRALTSFVGREEDIGTLLRRWDRVRAGEGQFVLIVGEPGLGKSRLMEEFHTRLGETPHTWTECSSSQLLQNTPLHPLAEWGRLRFGEDLPAEQRLADLENSLRLVGLDVGEYAPLIAPLVDIPLAKERAARFAPEELRRRQLAAVTAWFLAGARSQPVVLAFEDLHWADPTSLDLIQALAERGAQAPLLVVATTRPEFRAPWGMRSHHAVVALAPLDRTEVRRMVGEIAAQQILPQEVVERVSERTGGVPLFVEEVTRLLVERGDAGSQAVPPTLQQSLAARLDRLGAAREVAQVGSVLGRDFVYVLLRDVAELDESALRSSLERLAEADLLHVEGAPPQAKYRFKHALIQDAAYDSLLKSRRQVLHRRAAEALREANAEPEAIAHHFTQAGLDDLAIEWWGKAGDQALRRSAFQEAIAHLGKAIEMTDRVGATTGSAPRGSAAPNQRLTQLHVARANALWAARGVGAPETTEAFARARDSAYGDKDTPERLPSDFGLWASSYMRGELPSMRAHTAAFLSDLEARPDSPEASVAHRAAGITCWFAGDYHEARDRLERALALFQPGRDDDLAYRFGWDPGVAAMANLAAVSWPLGEVDRATSLMDRMKTRVAGLTHVGTLASGKLYAAMFELMRGDHLRATPNAFELVRLAREQEMGGMFRAFGVYLEGWASAASGATGSGLNDMRRGVEQLREQNVLFFDGLLKIALAEAEARAGDADRAIAILDEALVTVDRLGYRAFEAELHRARGEILLKRGPANPAPAEEALLTAIAVSKQQATRSFQLRAALALAKLHQSTNRRVEAHAVLAPALEGFSPTPEMPEIAEAQALLGTLTETGEVKNATASRQRRLQLQTSYSRAVMWSRGYGAEETQAAFARAQELATGVDNAAERFDAYYGQWAGRLQRGELRSARETAERFLREAEKEALTTEEAAARRCLGVACLWQGDLAVARAHFEQALRIFDPERDREAKFRFGMDIGVSATVFLALANWLLGEAGPARKLIEEAIARAVASAHSTTLASAYWFKALFDAFRDDAEAGRRAADSLLEVSRRHSLGLFLAFGALSSGWAHARLGDRVTGMAELRQALAAYAEQGNKFYAPFFQGLLAELEAEDPSDVVPLARIDEALALAEQTGQRWTDALLHRIRGDVLLKADPENAARAEEAYLAAIGVAREQGARSFQLRAALSLAKLYQSTSRLAEAQAVLAPALEGFAPTPEMPEIGEAQALLATIEAGADVRHQ